MPANSQVRPTLIQRQGLLIAPGNANLPIGVLFLRRRRLRALYRRQIPRRNRIAQLRIKVLPPSTLLRPLSLPSNRNHRILMPQRLADDILS